MPLALRDRTDERSPQCISLQKKKKKTKKQRRRLNLPQEVVFSLVERRFVKKEKGVESTTRSGGEANVTTNNVGFYSRMNSTKNVPTSVEKRLVDIKKVL